LIHLLSPFAPHLSDELWSMIGGQGSLVEQPWLEHDERYTTSKAATIVIQINGKVRSHLEVVGNVQEDDVKKMAFNDEKIQRHLEGKTVRKTVYVPSKILNIVVQ
jgi:leucyl-tRNA synthetase